MKNIKIIIGAVVILIVLFWSQYFFLSEFESGVCIKDNRDGYVWHVNSFDFGKYCLMGWQGNAWGNEVKMDRDVLERRSVDGIKVYKETECSEYQPQ